MHGRGTWNLCELVLHPTSSPGPPTHTLTSRRRRLTSHPSAWADTATHPPTLITQATLGLGPLHDHPLAGLAALAASASLSPYPSEAARLEALLRTRLADAHATGDCVRLLAVHRWLTGQHEAAAQLLQPLFAQGECDTAAAVVGDGGW